MGAESSTHAAGIHSNSDFCIQSVTSGLYVSRLSSGLWKEIVYIYIYVYNSKAERPRGVKIERLFDYYLGLGDEIWHTGEKISKIGNVNINNFLRYDTEEF